MKKLLKLIFTVVFIFGFGEVFAQKNYNIGLNLFERTELVTGVGGHPTGSRLSNQPLTGLFFEQQENKHTHRVSLGYLNMDHSLNLNKQDLDKAHGGNFSRSKWDIGYDFLYAFGKRKGFSPGLGLSYLEDKLINYTHGPQYYDYKNKAFAPQISMEANIKFLKTWYVNPSVKWLNPFYFNSVNRSDIQFTQVDWRSPGLYLTPLRISIKKTLFVE